MMITATIIKKQGVEIAMVVILQDSINQNLF